MRRNSKTAVLALKEQLNESFAILDSLDSESVTARNKGSEEEAEEKREKGEGRATRVAVASNPVSVPPAPAAIVEPGVKPACIALQMAEVTSSCSPSSSPHPNAVIETERAEAIIEFSVPVRLSTDHLESARALLKDLIGRQFSGYHQLNCPQVVVDSMCNIIRNGVDVEALNETRFGLKMVFVSDIPWSDVIETRLVTLRSPLDAEEEAPITVWQLRSSAAEDLASQVAELYQLVCRSPEGILLPFSMRVLVAAMLCKDVPYVEIATAQDTASVVPLQDATGQLWLCAINYPETMMLECALMGGRIYETTSSRGIVVSPMVVFHDSGKHYTIDAIGHFLLKRNKMRRPKVHIQRDTVDGVFYPASRTALNKSADSSAISSATLSEAIIHALLQVPISADSDMKACVASRVNITDRHFCAPVVFGSRMFHPFMREPEERVAFDVCSVTRRGKIPSVPPPRKRRKGTK